MCSQVNIESYLPEQITYFGKIRMLGKRAGKTDLIGPSEGAQILTLWKWHKSNPSTGDKFENRKSRRTVLTPTRSALSPKTETDS